MVEMNSIQKMLCSLNFEDFDKGHKEKKLMKLRFIIRD